MDIRKKIPAFTLMEVTISMLIAAIAIGVTYTAYRIVSGTYQDYIKKQDRVAVYRIVDQLLKKDFVQASLITRTADGALLQLKGGQVRYELNADYILREQFALQTDTFKMPVKAWHFSFEKQLAEEGAIADQLDLQVTLEAEDLSRIYHKSYSTQDLFNSPWPQ